jgi:hypothetical protein
MGLPTMTAPVTNPFSGVFGNGQIEIFPTSRTFTVPLGVANVRVRLWGAGGGGSNNGGGGAGFAMKVVDVSTVSSVAVTVGATGNQVSGGTSSFGAFVSATGGAGGVTAPFPGGTGVGGDVNYVGGTGNQGAGGAANLFGNGGNGAPTNAPGGNGASGGGGGNTQNAPGGNGIFSTGGGTVVASGSGLPPTSGMISPSIDLIGTGGGGSNAYGGGVNGGGASGNGNPGGFPGGGGNQTITNHGGNGLVIVEY